MEWIHIKNKLPEIGQLILGINYNWPAFYWMGVYKGVPNEDEDMFDFWLALPIPPNKEQTERLGKDFIVCEFCHQLVEVKPTLQNGFSAHSNKSESE